MRVALLLLIAACASKPAARTPSPLTDHATDATPVPAPSTGPSRDDCKRAGDNTFGIAKPALAEQLGDKLDQFGARFVELMTTRCMEDGWTKDAAQCLIDAKVTDDITKCTNEKFTKDQQEKIAQGFVVVFKELMQP